MGLFSLSILNGGDCRTPCSMRRTIHGPAVWEAWRARCLATSICGKGIGRTLLGQVAGSVCYGECHPVQERWWRLGRCWGMPLLSVNLVWFSSQTCAACVAGIEP